MKTFQTSLVIGTKGELAYERYLAHFGRQFTKTSPSDFEGLTYEYDYVVWSRQNPDEPSYTVELKTLAGRSASGTAYPTFCIEVWAKAGKRPGWWRSVEAEALSYVAVVNLHTQTMFVFDAAVLREKLMEDNPELTVCKDGNIHANGLIAKVPWRSEAHGYMIEIDMRRWL